MMINHENKFLFISTPKAGTHTMYDVLYNEFGCELRDDKGKVRKYEPEKIMLHPTRIDSPFKNYYKFTIVRNPYERAVSFWTAINREGKERYISLCGGKEFSDYAKAISDRGFLEKQYNSGSVRRPIHVPIHAQFCGQSEWHKNNVYDDVIHLENIIEEFHKLSFVNKTIEFPQKFSLSNLRSKPWKEYYTKELRQIVYNAWKEDFERYGYSEEL